MNGMQKKLWKEKDRTEADMLEYENEWEVYKFKQKEVLVYLCKTTVLCCKDFVASFITWYPTGVSTVLLLLCCKMSTSLRNTVTLCGKKKSFTQGHKETARGQTAYTRQLLMVIYSPSPLPIHISV